MSMKVVMALLLVGLSVQQCTIGCLRCSANNQCLLCDISNGYYSSATTCLLSALSNCQLIGLAGGCVQCSTGYYLDQNTQQCLAVPSLLAIANCTVYGSGQACTQCATNTYLSAGQCLPVVNFVANCIRYTADGVCSACASGFLLSNDFSACNQIPSGNNCLYYSYIGCGACNNGFINNPNLYFTNFNSNSFLNSFYLSPLSVARYDWIQFQQCQATAVPNCLTFSAFNVCTSCAAGYFLSNGICVAYPLPVIFACQTYSTLTTCSQCQPGYYLNNNNCIINLVIANCTLYSGSASTTTCLQCTTGYFVQSNICVARVNSLNINNCQTVTANADTCAVCSTGFVLTNDGRACLAALPNCVAYAVSNFQVSVLQCSLCSNGYYLINSNGNSVCNAGSIQNCLTYQVNANNCTVCDNGFYLRSGACIAHVAINNCQTYSQSVANTCAFCSSGYYSFSFTTVCVPTTVRPNCLAYSLDGNSCITCSSGYYVNGGVCSIIPAAFANCAIFSNGVCTLCNPGFMVNTLAIVGTCVVAPDYIYSSSNSPCAVQSQVLSTQIPVWTLPSSVSANQTVLTCLTCNDYMFRFQPNQAEAICVNTTQLVLDRNYVAVPNCLRYGVSYDSTAPVVCMQCVSGYYLSNWESKLHLSLATSCVSSCSLAATNSPAIVVDDTFGFVNICAPYIGSNNTPTTRFEPDGVCARYGRVYYGDITGTDTAGIRKDNYACFATSSQSGNLPTNFMNYWFVSALTGTTIRNYFYDGPSNTAQFSVAGFCASLPYSNTLDKTALFPSVFNYKGLLNGSKYSSPYVESNNPGFTGYTAVPGGSSIVLSLNNVINCDILMFQKSSYASFLGTSWNVASTPLFKPMTVDTHGCFRCAFGYQLVFSTSGTQATTPAFPSCASLSTCASNTAVYGGLTQFLNSILSCHVCSSSSGNALYPTINIETDAVGTTGTFVGYQTAAAYSGAAPNTVLTGKQAFTCAAAPSTVVINNTPTTGTITNCGVYGSILPVTGWAAPGTPTNAVTGTLQSVCLACTANNFPTYLVASGGSTPSNIDGTTKLPGWVVIGCTASSNCDTSFITQFNGCSACRTDQDGNLTPTYYAFHDFTFSNCFKVNSRFCFVSVAGAFSTTGTNTCGYCKAGYFLNSDSICESYRIPNESANNAVFINAYAASQFAAIKTEQAAGSPYPVLHTVLKMHYNLGVKQLLYGVSSCNAGYTLAPPAVWSNALCVWSSYIYNNTGSYPAGSAFINNCVRYNLTKVNNKNVCGGCNTGYIPTQDGLSCVTTIPNCQFAQNGASSALCYQCIANYNNIAGVCSSATISSCVSYLNTQWSFSSPGSLQCATCANGYAVAADRLSCQSGNVTNCAQYAIGAPNTCVSCLSGYVLLTLGSLSYCYPVAASLNCAILQDTSGTSGGNYATISCAQCVANQANVYGVRTWASVGLPSQAQTVCMPFTPIANCLNYNQNNAIINQNTFSCLNCSAGYYFSTSSQACVPRTNQPTQCTGYSLFADTCTGCASGYFLSANAQNCVAFPNGIYQCSVYSTAVNCTRCNPGYYLSNNACIASTVIQNCAVYSANFTCSICASGYFLTNSTYCQQAIATNCLTYTSINTCASCPSGLGLQTTNGITSCVNPNLANCLNATQTTPFTCLVCNTGFYPNTNGVCTAVTRVIASCVIYDSATTCSRCAVNTVLNVARTACNSTFYQTLLDPNCASSFLLNQPQCVQCPLGSLFVNGSCTACSNNTLAQGCLSCDPLNQNSCLVCKPTYYMNNLGNCIANNPTPTPTPNPTPNTTATASLTTAFAATVALTAVYYEWA